jgi:hypothetical protein
MSVQSGLYPSRYWYTAKVALPILCKVVLVSAQFLFKL